MKNVLFRGLFVLSLLFVCNINASAQLGNILNKVITTVTGTKATSSSIVGTWKYKTAEIELESGNALTNILGNTLSDKANKYLTTTLTKAGLTEDSMTITFVKDGTFTSTVKGKTVTGKYTLDKGKLTLTTDKNNTNLNFTATVSLTDMKLKINANKLYNFLSIVSEKASAASSTASALSGILKKYDGMSIALSYKK